MPNFLQHNTIRFLALYIGVCVLCVLDFLFRPAVVRTPFTWILRLETPFESRVRSMVSFVPSLFTDALKSQELIQDLQSRNAALQAQIAESEFLKKENESLRKEVEKRDVSTLKSRQSLVARVISTAPAGYLEIGEADGVQDKDLIFAQGVLLGQIQSADAFFSRWNVIDQGQLAIVGETQSGIKGVLLREKNSLVLSNIPADKQIEKGNLVYSSGSQELNIPKGLFIGEVESIQSDPGSPFKSAVVKQPIDWETLSIVTVEKF